MYSDTDLKNHIALYINDFLDVWQITPERLADLLGIGRSRLSYYLKAKELPRVDILVRLANLGKISLDDLLKWKGLSREEKGGISIVASGRQSIAAGRDVLISPKIHRQIKYSPSPEDISPQQASQLKSLVDKIAILEKDVKMKPRGYGAIWSALNRKMGVTYYREIKRQQYPQAEVYLNQWLGRLKRGLGYRTTNYEKCRKERYKAIFARGRELGWTKGQIDDCILNRYSKTSIQDLTKEELEQFYNWVFTKP